MAEKKFHKGWLYERDGVKFAPYTLKESIVDRNGKTWADIVDSKLGDLESSTGNGLSSLEQTLNAVQNRTTTLETRTQYLDASARDVFYITDKNGNIGLKVDNSGAVSFNFQTPQANLNDIAGRTSELESSVININANLQNQIIKLQQRTKFFDASEETDKFYVTDGNGNIAAIIDGNGITSFNFISKGVTDLNSLYAELSQHSIKIEEINTTIKNILQTELPLLVEDIEELQIRTKYVYAGDDDSDFIIADGNGNIVAKIDSEGITSFNFVSKNVGSLNELYKKSTELERRISDIEVYIPVAIGQINTDISLLTNRVCKTEERTKYIYAADDEDKTFEIVDKDGNVGMRVNNVGVTSIDFIIKEEKDEDDIKLKETIISLKSKDGELSQAITSNYSTLDAKIDSTKSNLEGQINTTKDELVEIIDNNAIQIQNQIDTVKQELNAKDNELSSGLSKVTTRTAELEKRTKYFDASDNNQFIIADESNNIGMLVDNKGVTAMNFNIQVSSAETIPVIGYKIEGQIEIKD